MERISFLLTVFLVSLQGSSAVTDVFVQKGSDVLLNVTEGYVMKPDDAFAWKFNQKKSIVRFIAGTKPTIFTNYAGRVEFSEQTYSVKLKNLQASDSGVYEAQVTGNEERTLGQYNVTVQVPPPHPINPIVIVIVTVIVAIIIVAAIYVYRRRNYNTENIEHTVYATPQGQTTQTLYESPLSDASCTSPESIYSLAGPHTGATETRANPQPDILYAEVEKPTKPCRILQEL